MDQQKLDAQRALYGTTLAQRMGQIMQTYDITQRELAKTLGLSAPMLSQLIHAQRVKIGNPKVFARLVMLEQRCAEPDLKTVLEEVEASSPALSTQQTTTQQSATQVLKQLATAQELHNVANYAHQIGATRLAQTLKKASETP